jgi:cytochrome c oxidase cbb3-type subunit 1
MVPKLWGRKEVYSLKLVDMHLWIATLGIVVYICAMWVSGIMQGLMWRSYDGMGFLQYSFVETVMAMHPFYILRMLGGLLYLSGALIMVYNFWRTIRGDVNVKEQNLLTQGAVA